MKKSNLMFASALLMSSTASFAASKQINVTAAMLKDISRETTVAKNAKYGNYCDFASRISIELIGEKKSLEETTIDARSYSTSQECAFGAETLDSVGPLGSQQILLQTLVDIKEDHINQEHVVEGDYFRVICSKPTLRLEVNRDSLKIIDWQVGKTAIHCP